MPLDQFATVWIDTDGKFKIQGFVTKQEAIAEARYCDHSGVPAVMITRDEIIAGDFKSVAQLEAEEDEAEDDEDLNDRG